MTKKSVLIWLVLLFLCGAQIISCSPIEKGSFVPLKNGDFISYRSEKSVANHMGLEFIVSVQGSRSDELLRLQGRAGMIQVDKLREKPEWIVFAIVDTQIQDEEADTATWFVDGRTGIYKKLWSKGTTYKVDSTGKIICATGVSISPTPAGCPVISIFDLATMKETKTIIVSELKGKSVGAKINIADKKFIVEFINDGSDYAKIIVPTE